MKIFIVSCAFAASLLIGAAAWTADKTAPRLVRSEATEPQLPLSQHEHDVIADALKREHGGNITIACATILCKPLADSVAALFDASGWRVVRINHGGLGIDGAQGIMVNSCGLRGEKVARVLRKATSRLISSVDDGKCQDGALPEIYVVIGSPDF